ncbi:MAG: hypothetical protein RSB84_04755 [Erysipelotrichaceae bacterium]
MQLVNNSSAYEFINYHLSKVDYLRNDREVLKDIKYNEISRAIDKNYLILKLKVQYIFEHNIAIFIYDGYYKIIDKDIVSDETFDSKLIVKELYEMVQIDINNLINDVDEA